MGRFIRAGHCGKHSRSDPYGRGAVGGRIVTQLAGGIVTRAPEAAVAGDKQGVELAGGALEHRRSVSQRNRLRVRLYLENFRRTQGAGVHPHFVHRAAEEFGTAAEILAEHKIGGDMGHVSTGHGARRLAVDVVGAARSVFHKSNVAPRAGIDRHVRGGADQSIAAVVIPVVQSAICIDAQELLSVEIVRTAAHSKNGSFGPAGFDPGGKGHLVVRGGSEARPLHKAGGPIKGKGSVGNPVMSGGQ